jgi:hypothetical protein
MRSLGGLVCAECNEAGTPQLRARKTSYVLRLVLFLGCTASFPAAAQFLQKVFNLKPPAKVGDGACYLPLKKSPHHSQPSSHFSHLPHKNPNLTTQPTF